MALAYRAGAPLKDMEFVQYHPTGLPFTGILITEAARAEGGWLLNKDGYRYLQDYDLGKPDPEPVLRSMELGPRDRLSQAFVHEEEKGRTVDTPYGQVVHLDLRHLGAKLIDAKLPFVRELCLKYENIDPVTELDPGPAGRALHDGRRPHRHRRGDAARRPVRRGRVGLRQHQRRQPAGLQLAAGVPGLRRPRGAGGRRVRRHGGRPPVRRSRPRRATRCAGSSATCWTRRGGRERASRDPRTEMQDDHGGELPASTAPGLAWPRVRRRCASLQERSAPSAIDDHSRTFNTELVAALELANMLDVAEAIIAVRPCGARSRAARTSAPTSRNGTTSGS